MTGLAVLVIYHNPTDYPGRYVVRRQVATAIGIVADGDPLGVVDTLDAARALVPEGMYRLDRHPTDEPQIVESWM